MASNNRNLSGKCIARNFYRNYNCKTCVLSRAGRDREATGDPQQTRSSRTVADCPCHLSALCPLCALTPSHLAYQCQTQTISVLSLGRIASACRLHAGAGRHNRCLHHPDLRPHNRCLLRVWDGGVGGIIKRPLGGRACIDMCANSATNDGQPSGH